MKPIEFPEVNTIYAKDQPEYIPLPCHKTESGDVISCFELSEEEIQEIIETKKLWLSVRTFNKPLQPIFLSTKKEDVCIVI
jgi:hypothetical protein